MPHWLPPVIVLVILIASFGFALLHGLKMKPDKSDDN
jgi:hypothetical protein